MNNDALTIEELNGSEGLLADDIDKIEVTRKICLNCGTEITDKFCPHCGQSVKVPERMTNHTFWKSVFATFTRWNTGFLNTAKKLSYKPWEVIKDYIQGKQVNYSHPVTMVIQLGLYTAFIVMFVEGLLEINFRPNFFDEENTNWFIASLKNSTVLKSLWISFPLSLAAYLVYWKHGSRRFTFSEYVIAVLYFLCSIRLYTFFFSPVNYILSKGDIDLYSYYNCVIVALCGLFLGVPLICKAFPIKSKGRRIWTLIKFFIVGFFFVAIYWIIFAFIDDLLSGYDMDTWFYDYFIEDA